MEFTEEHAKRLLSKEWLAKSDSATSTPYLMKYDFSSAEMSCWLLVTDTKMVWAEALNSKQLARRWRSLNPHNSPDPFVSSTKEGTWRDQTLDLLSKAHTIGGVGELSFEIVESNYADLSFELECEAFKWRWESNALGHRWSAEIISKHLVLPLISLSHLTFSSADAMSEVPDVELEKAVDKLGRTARRTIDTHIKNALSKPRVSTAIRRMTATFNSVPDLPPVTSTPEMPLLQVQQFEPEEPKPPSIAVRQPGQSFDNPPTSAPEKSHNKRERSVPHEEPQPQAQRTSNKKNVDQSDSATESEGDDEAMRTSGGAAAHESFEIPQQSRRMRTVTPQSPAPETAQAPPASKAKPLAAGPGGMSDSDSSPHRPVKKAKSKAPTSSEEDSEEERKKRVARLKGSGTTASGGAVKRGGGTRQPIKRGGKRF